MPKKTERKIIQREPMREEPFSLDPDERLNALVSGVINIEPKSITLLSMGALPRTGSELRNAVIGATNGTWVHSSGTFEGYCKWSFLPIGLVAEEHVIYDTGRKTGTRAWRTNKAGDVFGKTAAAFALRQAVEYSISMYRLFGSTHSPGRSRAPLTRFRLLEYLQAHGEVRQADVADYLDIGGSSVLFHLKSLADAGILTYDSVPDEEAGWAIYTWAGKPTDALKPLGHRKKLTQDVVQYMSNQGSADRHQVVTHLLARADYKHRKPKSLQSNVSNVLSGLEQQGFLTAPYKGRIRQSRVQLTDIGTALVTELIAPIRKFVGEDYTLGPCNEWEPYAPDAVRLYKSVYGFGKTRSFQEYCEDICGFVVGSPEGCRTKAIEEHIGTKPTRYLNALVASGSLIKQTEGKKTIYWPASR